MSYFKNTIYQFIILAVFVLPVQAAEPITLMGINIQMTNDEIREVCKQRGFLTNYYRGEIVTFGDLSNDPSSNKLTCKSTKVWKVDPLSAGVVKGTVRDDGIFCGNKFTEYTFESDGTQWKSPYYVDRRGDTLKCSKNGESFDIGRKPNSDWIHFSCEALGACGSSLQEISGAIFQVVGCRHNCQIKQNTRLTKKGSLTNIMRFADYDIDYEESQFYKPDNYCMRGKSGDVICINPDKKSISLHMGNFGRPKLDFN